MVMKTNRTLSRESARQPARAVAPPAAKKQPAANLERAFGALLSGLKPVKPPRALRAQVLANIAHDVQARALQCRAILTVPASDEGWQDLLPKVRGKRVYTDGMAESWLIRLESGAHAPAHDHPGAEECLVLEGSIRYLRGSTLHAGDYEVVQPGAHHSDLVSDAGALVFLRYAQPLDRYISR